MAISVQDVITDALSLVDFAQFGEAPEAEAEKLAVRTLNGMLGEWSTKNLINPKFTSIAVTPQVNDRVTLSATPPTGVTPDVGIDFFNLSGVTAELGPVVYTLSPISLYEYERLSIKQIVAPPSLYAFDAQSPVGTIYLYPRPLASMLVRITGTPRIGATAAQQTIDLDDAYYEGIVYNLACRLYPHLKRDVGIDQEIIYIAKTALTGWRQRNIKMRQKKARTGFAQGQTGSGYWTSPLNTVTR